MDSLPFQISEELKTKNLYHFIIPTESSNNKITLLIYENQKYRPVIGSWGNVIGVHIFPSVDRRPFTNEAGNKAWSGTLEDIQPINGFKWAVGGWELIIEKGLTDDEGWQYARKWSNLKENKAPSDSQRALSFVRRRRWKRVMEINLESVQQLLPYELLCRVQLTNRSNNTNNFQNATILYVEIDVNDTEHDNGVIGPPHWFKDFTIPLTHLSPFKRFKIKLLRNGKLLTNSNSFPTTTTAVAAASGGSGGGGGNPTSSSSKYTEEISLAEIMQETSKTGSSFKKSIYCDNKLLYDIDIEWKIVQNDIFHIQNKEKFFSKGELQEMILSEAKLSQRLKEKIIMLSLALGNEKCHSLIREITLLMVEGQNYLDDLDLIEVLDDVNHISGGNEFEKVLLLLKDAENNDKIMNKLYYPSSIFAFGIFLEIQNQQRWNLRKPNNQLLLNRIDDLYDLCSSWFFGQPSCYPNILKSYHQKWLKETKFISSSSSNNHNNHHHSSSSSPYSVILLLKDEGMTFELIAKNISDYIFLLRILSIAKYYHQTGFYNKMNFYSNDILSVHVVIKIDKKVFHDGLIYVDCEDGSIEFSTTGKRNPETDAYFPLKLPFEYFDGAILSHSYHYSLHYLVEIKVLSATSFALQSASDAMFRVNIDTINGQHQQCDFMLTQESPNQPVTGSVDQTIHLLLPAEIVEFPERLEHFATLTFSYDQSSVTRNTPANNAGPTVTPPRSNSSRNNAVDGSGGNRISDKSRDKRVSSIFGSSNSDLLSSTKQQQHQQRKAINPSTLVKLGQSSIFTSQRGIHKNDNEFQISLEKLSSFRLKIFLKQFTWMFMNHDNNNNNHDLSLVPSDVYVMIYLADRDGEILVPTATSMTYDSPTKKRSSVVSSTASSNSSSSTVSRAGNAVFRSCITSKKLNYSWSNESIEIDSKQVAALELTNYLIIELWSKGTITGSGKYDEDHLLGESLIPINPYKFSNATDLDCLIHQSDPNCDLCNHVTSPLLGFGHVQVKLHTILPTDGSISPTTPNTVRGSARIRSNNLIKLAISSKPIQPTDCAWPSHIINHTEKTIDSNIFYFSVHQDGIHIQTESLIPGTPLVDKAAILEECMEKVYTATTGKLHLIMKYENIRLDDIFILNDNTLLVGLQFKRKMQSSSSSSSNPSKEALMKATNKAVFREIRFEFLIGPCLAEDIYVTIANKVSLQPLRNQLVTHVQSSDKELEESFYSIAKLFQDSIYETITNISTALQDIKASNSFDLDDNSDLDGTHSARMSMQDRRSEEDNNESSKTGTNTTSTLTASQEVIEETRQRQLERMKEMQKRLEEVESWNKILPRFVNTNTTATSLTTAIAANTVTSFSSYSYMHSCTLKLLYLKKATLMIYLWYLIEQSPINLNAEKHYIEASWILFDEIEQHVNSDIMDTEDLDNLIYRIKDMMMKLEKEIRYQILKAFRNTIIGIDISLDLSKCIYEKYITIISMLLGTLEYSELDWNARQQQLLLFQQQQQQQQKEQGGVRPSIEIRSSEYGGRASTLSTVGLGGADTASSLTKPNKGFVPSHKSYIISNPQKKRDLIKFIIINDNMFEEYCNAILISHHYNFNKRPLLSYCINFDDLLNKFSHILDENLLMWNHRIMKYFMNTREEESNLLMNTNSNGKGGGKNDKQQKEEDLLLLQTSKTSKPFYSGSNNRDSSSPTNLASSDKSKASSNTLSTSQLLPWDITLYFDKDHQKDLFISNIPETIQLQLNIEIGLKKITPMYLEDMNNKNNTNNSNSNELALLDQDEESLYRIDLMNNKIAQAIARSYITLASEFEKVLLSNLVQYPDAVMSSQVNSNTRISLLGSSDNSKNSNGGGSGSNGNSGINGDVDEKDEIICFLLSMINDSYRIIHTHVPQSMNLFMNDYYQRFRKQQQHRASRYASHGGKGSGRRGKSSMGRQSLSRHSIHSLGGDSFLSGSFMENNQSSLMNYESMNMITFKTSLKAMSAISRKAINDLTNQIFFHCDLKAYFLAGFDEFFGLRNTMTRYLSSNGVNNASASVLGGMNANYTRQQKLYSFVTRTSLSSNPNANSNNGGNVIGGDDSQYTTMDTLLATISEFFLFIKDHVNVSDLEKIFYLCMKKILLRYLLFLRDFHLYIDTLRKRMKTPTNSEIEKNKTKNNGSNSTNTTPKGTSKPFGGFFTHKVRPEKKKAAAATTNKDNNAQPTMKSIPENQEENTEKDRENEFSKDENIIERERKKREKLLNNNEENEIEVEGEEVEERNNLEEEEETSNSPLERQGSMFRRTNWFSLQNNPLLSNENYLEAVYETWMKDSKSVMKFYSEMKMKLFPQSFRPANYNQDESSSSKKSKFDDLDDSNNNSGRNSENNNNNNKGDEENIELIDDEKSSPYKQTITLLLNYLSHCIVLSRTDEYTNEGLINEFILNGFGITFPTFVLDPIKYHPEIEKLFKLDPAFMHFAPSIEMLKYQKKYMLSQITGEPLLEDDQLPVSMYSSTLTTMHLHNPMSDNGYGGNRMPMSICNIQICGLAVYHVMKYKNLFLKISMNDKRFMTSISPNTGDTPHWNDVFLVERIPITACKTITIELFAFKLRAFKVMREYKIGEATINLMEILRNETANIQESPNNYKSSSIFSSFSADKKSSNNNKKLSNQWDASNTAALDNFETESVISNIGNPHFNGFNHTAWYVIPTNPKRFFQRGSAPTRSSMINRGSSFSATRTSMIGGGSGRSFSAQPTATQNLSYIYALASKGPREDVEDPQLRITLKVHIL